MSLYAMMRLAACTWVCGRDYGTKEKAISEEKVPMNLTYSFHKSNKAIQ